MTHLRITATPTLGFRRCGVFHPAEAILHPLDRFSEAELERLQDEPNLVCELVPAGAPELTPEPTSPGSGEGEGGAATLQPDPPTDRAERIVAITAAIGTLDADNSALFTGDDRPKVEVIEAALGWNISAGERDEAWAVIQAATEGAKETTKK